MSKGQRRAKEAETPGDGTASTGGGRISLPLEQQEEKVLAGRIYGDRTGRGRMFRSYFHLTFRAVASSLCGCWVSFPASQHVSGWSIPGMRESWGQVGGAEVGPEAGEGATRSRGHRTGQPPGPSPLSHVLLPAVLPCLRSEACPSPADRLGPYSALGTPPSVLCILTNSHFNLNCVPSASQS